jgi:hypothetical protein
MNEKPTPNLTVETRSLKHTFTLEERDVIGGDLARAISALRGIEADLDSVKADFKAKITFAEAQIDSLCTTRANGFEIRAEKCVVLFRVPDRKKDFYLQADFEADPKKAVIQLTEDMTPGDFVGELLQAESKFDSREEIQLFTPAAGDQGLLIVGKFGAKWFSALRVKIGKLELTERLDSEQKCFKARPDAVKTAVERFRKWAKENLKDLAKGFEAAADAVLEAHKERAE